MWQVIFFQRKNIILSIETRDRVLFSSQTQVSTGVLERCMLPKEEVTWNRIDWFCSINVLNLMYLSLNLLFQYSQIISKRKKNLVTCLCLTLPPLCLFHWSLSLYLNILLLLPSMFLSFFGTQVSCISTGIWSLLVAIPDRFIYYLLTYLY